MTESGMSYFVGLASKSARVGLGADEGEREVADDLAARGDLDDVAEDAVGRGIHVLDLLEVVAEPERDGLLAQVGELAAGDLVRVDATGGGGQAGLEREVELAHRLPVGLEVADGRRSSPVARGRAVGGGDQARHRRLGRGAGHRGAGDVDGIDPGVDGGQQGRQLATRGVVGVQVHRLVEPLAQGRDEGARGGCAQQPGHVLDGDDVRAGLGDLLGEAQVVVERVELLARVGEVAGVAERDLGDGGAGGADGVDGRAHLADVVERVEDAEDVDAGARGLGDERVGDLGGVGRVADRVAPAQEHLQRQVGHRLAQLARGGPTGPRRGTAAPRRRSRRPRPRRRAAAASAARRAARRA